MASLNPPAEPPLAPLAPRERNFLVGRYIGQLAQEACAYAFDLDDEPARRALYALDYELTIRTLQHLRVALGSPSPTFAQELAEAVAGAVEAAHAGVAACFLSEFARRVSAFETCEVGPFQETYEIALARLRAAHAGAGPDPRYFVSLDRGGTPHQLASMVHVGGTTDPGARPTVHVRLSAASLGPREWRSIPYALCHELTAHAFAHPDHVERGDGFAEGWMDVVASDLASAVSAEQDSTSRPDRYTGAAADGAALHEARFQRGGDAALDESWEALAAFSARVRGRDAALHVRDEMVAEVGEAEGRAAFEGLSCTLNALALPDEVRNELIHAVVPAANTRTPLGAVARAYADARAADPTAAALGFARSLLDPVVHDLLKV